MGVLKTLRDTFAPELNHLYVQDPSEASGALDYRWRCREHALHAFLIARMFGAPAEICTGDFAVLSRRVPALSALGQDAQHAWCKINGVAPVDLSLTFRPLPQAPQLHAAVTGEGRNGAWQVTYADDESVLDEDIGGENEIIFMKWHRETKSRRSHFVVIYISGDKSLAEITGCARQLGFTWPTVTLKGQPELQLINRFFTGNIPQLVVTDRHGNLLIDSVKIGPAAALAQLDALVEKN